MYNTKQKDIYGLKYSIIEIYVHHAKSGIYREICLTMDPEHSALIT